MLLVHFSANQIAENLVSKSCHKITCQYELTVQFSEASNNWIEPIKNQQHSKVLKEGYNP